MTAAARRGSRLLPALAALALGCVPETIDADRGPAVPEARVGSDVVTSGDLSCPLLDQAALEAIDPDTLPAGSNPCREPVLAAVEWVTDGDTVAVVADGVHEDVRIIGVDTPEVWGTQECYGPEASEFAHGVLEGRHIWLSFDGDCIDPYDRTLAYVHLSDQPECFFERLLLRGGLAETLTFSATSTYAETFVADQRWASQEGLGLWSACR